ncbi:alpha/beta fold hydrolase [Accumulibacter sp.]|uniref:esterase/lipase family protein n=1 Tax=Accumulibacter sp. TaxID=2053492 RepID=UPI0025EA5540|nr:alpha/beta fold hydrolase [Accumulibacter sp.]MCM8614050.1 GPI inositol-deacylase [Accumulibacter sp.]MCM8637823.1 GPI inositol-deacylase [Accumulibacter sp.]MCM8641200.1 GPI inositol-deacylase [Accumulibacter sp.]
MPPVKTRAASQQPRAGRSQAAKIAVQQTTARVREMHQEIASKPFSVLRRVPFLAGPTKLVQIAHDKILAGVYQAIHDGSGVVFDAAAILEERRVQRQPSGEAPRRLATRMDAALNGIFGDHLAATENRLAIVMTLHHEGLALAPGSPSFPALGRRLCVFVHGLACDESSWQPPPGDSDVTKTVDFGQQLRADLGYTPLYLRYNSGLPISRNGGELAALLEQLINTSPKGDSELVIIGHSMGGLVAMAACQQAAAAGMRWPLATRMLICLGAPQLGSPLERLGHLITSALQVSTVTQPIARIATARSQGIQDLRHGPGAARAHPAAAHIAYRFLGGSLAEDVEQRFGRLLGDGLVTLGSATAPADASDVQTATLGRLGHMELLTDVRVYRQIGEWVAALEKPERAAASGRNVVQDVVTPKPRNKAPMRE